MGCAMLTGCSHLLHSMALLAEADVDSLAPENKEHTIVPFRVNYPMRQHSRTAPSPLGTPPSITSARHPSVTPISVATSISASGRTMLPPQSVPQSRTPSNGIMRPPLTPTVPTIPQHSPPPPQSSPIPLPNGNGMHDMNGDQEVKLSAPAPIVLHSGSPDDVMSQTDSQIQGLQLASPIRPKSQTPSMVPMQNGYAIPMNNLGSNIVNGATYPLHAGLRVNGMKSALASHITDGTNGAHMAVRATQPYIAHNIPSNTNYSAQLAAVRQLQWQHVQQQQQQQQQQQRAASVNGDDAMVGVSPPPPRTPSANGHRPVTLSRGLSSPALAQAMAAGQGRASPQHIVRLAPHQLSPGLPQAHASPPRPQPLPSPSLQARQIVGSSGSY